MAYSIVFLNYDTKYLCRRSNLTFENHEIESIIEKESALTIFNERNNSDVIIIDDECHQNDLICKSTTLESNDFNSKQDKN